MGGGANVAVETRPAQTTGGAATKLVAVVISALVYGALVYISRFSPHFLGLQILYPPVAVGPAFGLWFQGWGALGLILGTIISQLPAGMNPMVWVPANLAQCFVAIVPAVLYRKMTVNGWRSWMVFAGACVLAAALSNLCVEWNLALYHLVPFNIAMRSIFPVSMIDDTLWMVIVGPLVLNTISPYIVRSGLRLRRFL